MTIEFDLSRPEVRADPYPLLDRLRREDPVHWSTPLRGWLLTRYADVRAALNDPRLSADRITPFADHMAGPDGSALGAFAKALGLWVVFRDPPDHTRLRAVLARAFVAGAIQRLEPAIELLVDGLIDRVAAKGRMDAIADFANPLPIAVIGSLLGVPAGDFARLKAWSDDLATVVGTALATPDKHARALQSWQAMRDYFGALVERRKARPAADALGEIVRASGEEGGLDDAELVANAVLLLFAGHETTTNLIANAVLALIRHPDELARLARAPEIAESAVEEFLRYDGPVQALTRLARVNVELGGRRIRAGERVVLMLTGANRDPAQFAEPDRLELAREPNRHIAFGYGIHFCLGAPLARLEARIAIRRLIARLGDLTLAMPAPEWIDSLVFRGMRALPVAFTARGAAAKRPD